MPEAIHPTDNKKTLEILKLSSKKSYKEVFDRIEKSSIIPWFFQKDFDPQKVKNLFDYLKRPETSASEKGSINCVLLNNSLKDITEAFEQMSAHKVTEPFHAFALIGVEKTKQLCETLNYINESKVLGKLEPDIKEIINSNFRYSPKRTDLSLEKLKPELDKLEKFYETAGETVFHDAGDEILNGIMKGTKGAADLNPASAEFLKKLSKENPTIYRSSL